MPSILSPVYLQACSVCKVEFFSKNEWLKHLVEDGHQKLARKECLEKWGGDVIKKCLLVFTKVPLTKHTASKIVNHFSNKLITNSWSAIVTDFVWWEDRPHLGILQFESKQMVNNVLTSSTSKTIEIDENQTVLFKAGFKMNLLEWYGILPPTNLRICSKSVDHTKKKSLGKRARCEDIEPPKPKRPKIINTPLIGTTEPSARPLQLEFLPIREATIIRDIRLKNITTILQSVKVTLSTLDPNVEVYLFRNWFLKLKYPAGNSNVLIYLRANNEVSKNSNILCGQVGLTMATGKQKEFRILQSKPETEEAQLSRLYLHHLSFNMNVYLTTSETKGCLMEVQVCRLMEYMCQFDPRCYFLMTLVCFWVKLNSINVGVVMDSESESDLHPQYAIQWLVLFFMCHQGYIPTPQIIMNRQKFGISNEVAGWVHFDPKFVKEWKTKKGERLAAHQKLRDDVDQSSEEFILSVLQIFSRFLSFCYFSIACKKEQLILNLFHGLIIGKASFMYKPAKKYSQINNMTLEEIDVLQKAIGDDKSKHQLSLTKCGLYMTHPILLNHKIPISDNIKLVFNQMEECNKKLRSFLSHVEKFGAESTINEVGTLKNILKIKD